MVEVRRQGSERALPFNLAGDLHRHEAEEAQVVGIEKFSRPVVKDAQRADGVTERIVDGDAGVPRQSRLNGKKMTHRGVARGILDNQWLEVPEAGPAAGVFQ